MEKNSLKDILMKPAVPAVSIGLKDIQAAIEENTKKGRY